MAPEADPLQAEFDALPDIDAEFDALPDAPLVDESLPTATPTPKPGQSTTSQIYDFAKGAITEDIPATAEEAQAAAGGIGNLLQRAAELSTDLDNREGYTPMVSELAGLIEATREKLRGLPPKAKAAIVSRLVGSGAGSILGSRGGGAGTVAGGVIGNMAAGELNEVFGLEEDTPLLSIQKAKEIRKELVQGVLVPWVTRKTGQSTSTIGKWIKEASTPLDEIKKMMLGKEGSIAAKLSIGSRNTGSEGVFRRELARGEKTFSRINPIQNAKNADEAVEMISAAIKERSLAKKTLVGDVDQTIQGIAAKGGDAPLMASADLGFDELKEEIRKQMKTGVGAESAKTKLAAIEEFEEGFRQVVPQDLWDKALGRTRTTGAPKTLGEMQEVLDATYDELRKLKLYDDLSISKEGLNPSEMAKNAARVEVYQAAADSLKGSMDTYLGKLASKGIISKDVAKQIKTLNQEMHDIIPYRTAFERFSDVAAQAITTDPPRSLVQRAGAEFVRPQSARSAALDALTAPLTKGINERAAANAALGFEPGVMDDIQTAIGIKNGSIPPGVPGSPIVGKVGTGIDKVGEMLTQAGGGSLVPGAPPAGVGLPQQPGLTGPIIASLAMARDPDFSNSVEAYDTLVKDQGFLQQLEHDPDIPDDVKHTFLDTKTGTAFEKMKAYGMLKLAGRNKGWFPPPKMEGVHSFVNAPKGRVTDKGRPVLGFVTDAIEADLVYEAFDSIENIYDRAEAQRLFNQPGTNKGMLFMLPPSLVPGAPKQKKAPQSKPPPKAKTVKVDSGSSSGARVEYDH